MSPTAPGAKSPALCAHRGLSHAVPENTLPAFGAAIAIGVDEIEFDVYQTVDGIPVIVHDPDLSRVANVPHKVEELTLTEIKEIDLGSVYGEAWRYLRIPTLDEVLAICDGTFRLNIHMKMPGSGGDLVRLVGEALRRHQLTQAAYIGGYEAILEAAIEFCPEVQRSCMTSRQVPFEVVKNAVKYGCRRLQFFGNNIDERHVAAAHEAGVHCNVFYADTLEEAQRFLALGIDTILTNRALLLLNTPGSPFTRR